MHFSLTSGESAHMIEMPPTMLTEQLPGGDWVHPGEPPHVNGLTTLLADFVRDLPGVSDAVAVSVDGLVIAAAGTLPADRVEQLGAMTGSIASLSGSIARFVSGERFHQTIVEMDERVLLVAAIPPPGHLAVLASRACDLAVVSGEVVTLCQRLSATLTT